MRRRAGLVNDVTVATEQSDPMRRLRRVSPVIPARRCASVVVSCSAVLGATLVFLIAAASASAVTLYVTASGSATSACTSNAPCAVTRADALVRPGDTVRVGAGRYPASSLTRGGTSAAPVRWLSTTRWGAHFPSVHIAASAPFVTLEGFDVGGTAGTLVSVDGSYSRIVGNHVHDSTSGCAGGGGGIVIAGYQRDGYNGIGGEVLGNLVEDIGIGPRNGTCLLLHGIYSSIPRVLIVNNVERSALAYGIHLWHAARDNTIVNNTVTGNGLSGILIGAGDSGATGVTPVVTGNLVANNIVASNAEWGITECCDNSRHGPNRYVSNLGWSNGYGNIASGLIGNVRGGGSVSGSLYGDPLFAGVRDFHLRAGSPAIDSATSMNAPATDFDGTTRPQGAGVDRGAYEAVTAPGSQPEESKPLPAAAPTSEESPPGAREPSRDESGGTIAEVDIGPRQVRMVAGGTVHLRVACPRPEGRCDVQLRLLAGTRTIAARTLAVRGGRVGPCALKLDRAARRTLARTRSLRLTAVADVRTRAGHRGTTRISIRVLGPRRGGRTG
jgi:parallel beta-helix repeat protein